MGALLMDIREVSKTFRVSGGFLRGRPREVRAVRNVTLAIHAGETLGLVGESGCGKSTLGRLCLALDRPNRGQIRFGGRDISMMNREQRRLFRRDVQLVFQDPYASLNPRRTAGQTVMEPFILHGGLERESRIRLALNAMHAVGLNEEQMGRYPHEFSGGQRQRIGIARAIALKPKLIVADEPVSALDVSIQAQILNLMKRLQREIGLTYLFISHDFSVIRYMSDRIAVMYLGCIVELAPNDTLFATPMHPYTRVLLQAIPVADPKARRRGLVQGGVEAAFPGDGCPFYPRCPERLDRCCREAPRLLELGPGHRVACHRAGPEGGAA